MDSTLIYILLAVALGVVQYAMGAEKRKKAKLRQQQLILMQQQQQQEAQSETKGLPSWLSGILEEAEKPSGGFWDMIENPDEGVNEIEMDETVVEEMAADLPEEGASAMPLVTLFPVTPSAQEVPSIEALLERSQKEADAILAENSEEPSCLDDFSIEKAILYSEVLKPSWKD